ncbi:Extracellular serine protease [compost metagenome]
MPQQFWAMYLKARNNGVTAFSTHWSDLVSGQLLDAGQNIGDVHGDVIVSPGSADAAPTVINAGATIDGSLAALGSNTAPAVVDFAGSASIGHNLSATNAVLGFSKAPDATSHSGGNVNLASSTTLGGNIASPIQVDGSVSADADTTMGGNWKISGDLVNAGTLTPGNSIGVVGVGGNFILAPTSTYDVEVNSAGESDRTDVAGQTTLAGGVNVSALDGYRPGHNYLILTAQGGFAGTTFDANKLNWSGPDYQFLAPQLKYDSNNVYLLVDRNGTPFATVARTSNQKAVAAGLESLSFANQAYSTVATSTSTAGLADAFDQLSGEIHASARTALIDDSKYVRDAASARVREAFDKPAVSKSADAENIDGWVKIYGAEANTDASDGAASLDRKSTGVLFGGDTLVGDNLRIGVMGGVGKTDFDVNHRNSDGKSDNYTIGVYGGTQQGKLGIRAGAAHTWHEVETDRSVDFNGFKDKLSANYDARTTQLFGEVGYRLGDEKASVEPFAALAHVQQKTDGFKEKGGDAALTGKSESTDTTFSTLGVRGSTKLTVGSTAVTADGSLGWKHAYGDVDTSSTMALANGGPFDVSGAPVSKDAVAIEAGVKAEVAQNATVGLSYSGEVGSDGDEQAVKVDFTYRY